MLVCKYFVAILFYLESQKRKKKPIKKKMWLITSIYKIYTKSLERKNAITFY